MFNSFKKRTTKTGLPPGALLHIGKKRYEEVTVTVMDYNAKHFQEKQLKRIEECFPFKKKPTVTWINVDGVHNIEIIEKLGKCFDLHPLILEDIVTTTQRPKYEDFEDYIFVVLKMLSYDEKKGEIIPEQLSLVLGRNFVLSFQEKEGDVFNTIRRRIRSAKGRIRKMGGDHLAYSLIDATVDNYFLILEQFGEWISDIEEELVKNPTQETLHKIHQLKKELIFLRKSVWPLREVIVGLQRIESSLIKKETAIYLKDVYDHTIQVMDTIETLRDMASGMLEIYLSSVSNRLNEIMKFLTIIATIFIPLTFIVGLYGMNFKYMPEIYWRWGYLFVWFIIISVSTTMIIFFKKRKWF